MSVRVVDICLTHKWGNKPKQEFENLDIDSKANYHDPEDLMFILQGYRALEENLKNQNLDAYWVDNKKKILVIGEVKQGIPYAEVLVERMIKDGRPNPLYAALSSSEAEQLWGLADAQIRKDIERQRFYKNVETRQAGRVHMVTIEGLMRVHGMPHPKYFIEPERR